MARPSLPDPDWQTMLALWAVLICGIATVALIIFLE
jgi:hypothetical protein